MASLLIKTRITTFIKTKFKISDDQTNIDKFRLAANNTEYHYIKINLIKYHYSKIYDKEIIKCKNFPVERKNLVEISS